MSHGEGGTDGSAARRVLSYFEDRKREIHADLDRLLRKARAELGAVSPLGAEACDLLSGFTSGGKMIRGGLVCYAASLGSAPAGAALRVASAMELFQSALLIHDDIMDRDTTRRGEPSVHRHYEMKALDLGWPDAGHLGASLGVCAGDIAFFLAFRTLLETPMEPASVTRLGGLFARELSLVGVAQMLDMTAGGSHALPDQDQVLKLYLYKTGRYTFSLPLRAGSIIGALPEAEAARLDRMGEVMGLLFQIKDDELGLFGSAEETGKPMGSDIREGKKTIYHAALVRRSPPEVVERVQRSWGAADLDDREVRYILDMMVHHGARAEVEALAHGLAESARTLAADDPFLTDLLAYSRTRTR